MDDGTDGLISYALGAAGWGPERACICSAAFNPRGHRRRVSRCHPSTHTQGQGLASHSFLTSFQDPRGHQSGPGPLAAAEMLPSQGLGAAVAPKSESAAKYNFARRQQAQPQGPFKAPEMASESKG